MTHLDLARYVVTRMVVIVVIGLTIAAVFVVRDEPHGVIAALLGMFMALAFATLVLPKRFTDDDHDRTE